MLFRSALRRHYIRASVALFASFVMQSCSEESSPVGASLVPQSDRIVLHTLDSSIPSDSVGISTRQVTVHVPTGAATELLVGSTPVLESRAVFKFALSVDSVFTAERVLTAPLDSAYLLLHLGPYRFGDTSASAGVTLTVNEVLVHHDVNATWDSLGAAANYGPALGTYTGSIGLRDSILRIPLDTTFVKRLLAYKRFDSLQAGFQGLAILPQAGSNLIFSVTTGGSSVHLVYGGIAGLDTTILTTVQRLFIMNSTESDPIDRMIVQGSVAKRPYLTLSLPTLPKLSTVNATSLELTLDPAGCQWGKDRVWDSLGVSMHDSLFVFFASADSALGQYRVAGIRTPGTNTYVFSILRDFVELWKHGSANHGMTPVQSISGYSDGITTCDKFAFYRPDDPDTTRRPHIRIVYSTIGK